MRSVLFSVLVSINMLFGASATLAQQSESVQAIMAKVARNQDQAQEIRSAFVYNQTLLLRFRQGDGKTCREELREFTVAPTSKGTHKTLTRFSGKYLKAGKLIDYTEPGYHYKSFDLDSDLMTGFADGFTNQENSRDGLATDLFPLTSQEQKKYVFTLKGREAYRKEEVYRVSFKPGKNDRHEEASWAGEVLVDVSDCQPVVITTRLAQGVPFYIKTLLGSNVQHVGFKVEYQKFDENLWFPVSYGGEFKLKVLFSYKRTMIIALRNSGFQRAEVTTSLTFEKPSATNDTSPNPESSAPPEPTP